MMKTKMPSVRMVSGRVRMINNGRNTELIRPSTTESTNAVTNPSTCTPGSRYAVPKIASAFRIHPTIMVFKLVSLVFVINPGVGVHNHVADELRVLHVVAGGDAG